MKGRGEQGPTAPAKGTNLQNKEVSEIQGPGPPAPKQPQAQAQGREKRPSSHTTPASVPQSLSSRDGPGVGLRVTRAVGRCSQSRLTRETGQQVSFLGVESEHEGAGPRHRRPGDWLVNP